VQHESRFALGDHAAKNLASVTALSVLAILAQQVTTVALVEEL
jgi:hypothetical protein